MSDEKKSKFEAFLEFAGEHPILTFFLFLIILDSIVTLVKVLVR